MAWRDQTSTLFKSKPNLEQYPSSPSVLGKAEEKGEKAAEETFKAIELAREI